MQKLNFTYGILLFLFLAGCGFNKRIVDSDFSYKGRFSEYKTFGFLNSNVEGLDPEKSTLLKEVIFRRFSALGYHYVAEGAADLLITYVYRDTETTVQGYQQGDLSSWLFRNQYMGQQKEETYSGGKIKLPEGTLVIYLIDGEDGSLAWVGYSNLSVIESQHRNLVASAGLILDNYNIPSY